LLIVVAGCVGLLLLLILHPVREKPIEYFKLARFEPTGIRMRVQRSASLTKYYDDNISLRYEMPALKTLIDALAAEACTHETLDDQSENLTKHKLRVIRRKINLVIVSPIHDLIEVDCGP
jgi:hypothetical protein